MLLGIKNALTSYKYLQLWQDDEMVIFLYNEFTLAIVTFVFRNKMGPNFQMELKEKEKNTLYRYHYLLSYSLRSKHFYAFLHNNFAVNALPFEP